jgi:hypothetical protein
MAKAFLRTLSGYTGRTPNGSARGVNYELWNSRIYFTRCLVEANIEGFRAIFLLQAAKKAGSLIHDLIILIQCLIFVRNFIKTLDRIEFLWIIGGVSKYCLNKG